MSTAVGSPTNGDNFSAEGTLFQSNGAIGTRYFLWFFKLCSTKVAKRPAMPGANNGVYSQTYTKDGMLWSITYGEYVKI